MTLLKSTAAYLCFVALFLPPNVTGQNNSEKDSSNLEILIAAREIMNASYNCALISMDQEGHPRVRMMDPFSPETDFTVWLGTNPKSRKVDQIKKDPHVCLYYADPEGSGYVMIEGIAQLINCTAEKERHWKKEWEAFYPNRNEAFLLIRVSPISMEVVSYSYGLIGDTDDWKPPIITFDIKEAYDGCN